MKLGLDRRSVNRRTEDQSGAPRKARHWLAVAISKQPVLAGLFVCAVVSTVAVGLVLSNQGAVRDQSNEIKGLVVTMQRQRVATTSQFCNRINTNAVASNKTTDILTHIIIQSVRASKPFDNVYRRFGFPPYAVRLRQARRLAESFIKQKIPVLDCRRIAREIEATIQLPGTSSTRLDHYPH